MDEQFFTKSKYDFIGVEFKFEALAAITSENFAKEIERESALGGYEYIKKFHKDGPFFYFYAEDIDKKKSKLIKAYYSNKYGESFRIETIHSSDLKALGLKLIKEE